MSRPIKNRFWRQSGLLLWLSVFILLGCAKEEAQDEPLLQPSAIKILQEDPTDRTFDLVAGDDCMLATYFREGGSAVFVLLNNEAEIIWRKELGFTSEEFEDLIDFILYEGNGVFSIFGRERFVQINREGEILKDENDYFLLINRYAKMGVFKNSDGNYVSFGASQSATSRSFLSVHTPTGELIFRKVFLTQSGGFEAVTDCLELSNGDYLLVGTFKPQVAGNQAGFYVRKFSSEGDEIWEKYHERGAVSSELTFVGSSHLFGRELLPHTDGTFSYILNDYELNSESSTSFIVHLSADGDIMNEAPLNLAPTNIVAGSTSDLGNIGNQKYGGSAIARNSDGSYTGIANRIYESTPGSDITNRPPHFPYTFKLDAAGNLIDSDYSDRVYSTFYTSCVRLSNGKTAIYGRIISIGEVSKPLIILQE
jgi:hypothetical protein